MIHFPKALKRDSLRPRPPEPFCYSKNLRQRSSYKKMYKNFLTRKIKWFVVKQMKKETKRVEFEEYLVVKDGEFYIEAFCEDDKLDDLHLKSSKKFLTKMLYPDNNPMNERFPLRSFTQAERDEINKKPIYMFPGDTTRHPSLQHLLNRWLDTTIVLGIEEFNSISKSKPLTKPIVVTQGKYPLD